MPGQSWHAGKRALYMWAFLQHPHCQTMDFRSAPESCSGAAAYEDDSFTSGCPQRSTSTLATPGVGTAAQPRPYRPGYLTPNDANPGPALIQSLTNFDPFNYYALDATFQV